MTMQDDLEFASRTLRCGDVRASHVGQEHILKGWVHRRRDHGGLLFIDLRDREGLMQIRINPDSLKNDKKVGVDATIAWDGEPNALVEKMKEVNIAGYTMTAITIGDVNIFPDGRTPKADSGKNYRVRFLCENNEKSLVADDEEALVKALADAGYNASAPHLVSVTHHLREEFVVSVRGEIYPRPDGATNPNLATGEVEMEVHELVILNSCDPLPFRLTDQAKVSEEIRLRHRYLDLRRAELQHNMMVRSKLYKVVRDYLADHEFAEIETPILGKPTPEGARDFLVPSRLNEGMCYALPQSPQLFKQILMIGGYDRYFQIARCFRDEDLRANRQPEFTQIDIEMSFVNVEDVLTIMEGLAAKIWKDIMNIEVPTPFRRMPYSEAMERFGSDKPDLRFDMELKDLTPIIKGRTEFGIFNTIMDKGGAIVSVNHKGGADKYSKTALRPDGEFQKRCQRELGCKGVAFFIMNEAGEMESSIAKLFPAEVLAELAKTMDMEPGDIMFMVADMRKHKALDMAGRLRLMIAKANNIIPEGKFEFCWIVDFPLFEYDDETKAYHPAHHPFTMPHPEDLHKLESDPGSVRSLAYDLALNGDEAAGGSIRIHRPELQARLFKAIGISDEEAEAKFGFLLDALRFGAPPHGGIAFGFDRLLMSILNVESIRDVIAFPKTQTGTCLMTGAPGDVTEEQLKEVHVRPIIKPSDKDKAKA